MLPISLIRQEPDLVKERLKVKFFDADKMIDSIIELDIERRAVQTRLDAIKSESNQLSKEIGNLYKQGKRQEADLAKLKTAGLKDQSKLLDHKMDDVDQKLYNLLVHLPNIPHESVPIGKSEDDNEEISRWGTIPTLHEGAKAHWDLLEDHKMMSLQIGTVLTGAGFPVFMGKGAKLQRALVAFFLDRAIEAGYLEIIPPLMVNEKSAFSTGQLPDKEGQMYHVTEDDLFLIPTAEVPVTNMFRDQIIDENDLPIKRTAHSQCFRREAGSYGKDVRGLNRVHQFEKVEIVQIAHPDKSYETLDEMMKHVASLLEALELPYRILRLCSGDVSFAAALTYDFEVFSAAQERWLEVSSVSNFEYFQANRLKTRYRENETGKRHLVHTLNGSAMALPRVMAALLENNQDAEGRIHIPAALQPYTGFSVIE